MSFTRGRPTPKLDLTLNHLTLLPGVQQLSEDFLLRGGKRLRPKLVFLISEGLGISAKEAHVFARAAELVHSATLSHDDVIDEATLRRNRPTLNSVSTQARAVLTGDLLLARVVIELAETGRLDILAQMARVVEQLVTGEWMQLEARGQGGVTEAHLNQVAYLKTGSLIEWCVETPFRYKNFDTGIIAHAQNFGKHLGLAFQMMDDLLDFGLETGKEFAKDLSEGLINQVSFQLIKGESPHRSQILEMLSQVIDEEKFLKAIPLAAVQHAKEQVRKQATEYLMIAELSLGRLKHLLSGDVYPELQLLLEQMSERTR